MTSEPGSSPDTSGKAVLPAGPAEEIATIWRTLPLKATLLGLVLLWIALFHFLGNSTFGYIDTPSLFGWLNYGYSQTHDDELGRYVPFIVLFLCWWKRDDLVNAPKKPWLGGVAIVALSLLLHIIGFGVQQTRLSAVAFFLGLYGLIGVAWGWRFMQAIFFPFFLFVFCVPLGTLAETITFPLRMIATTITAGFSRTILGISLMQDGTRIFDSGGHFQYEVAAACGGLRSLTATFALAAIYAFMAVERPWKRLIMIASSFPLAVAGNVLRLTLIIIAAEEWGQKGGNWVHDNPYLSLLPYLPAFLGLRALGGWLREKPKPPEPTAGLTAVQSA